MSTFNLDNEVSIIIISILQIRILKPKSHNNNLSLFFILPYGIYRNKFYLVGRQHFRKIYGVKRSCVQSLEFSVCLHVYSCVIWEQYISLKIGIHKYSLSITGIKGHLINISDTYYQCYGDKVMEGDIYFE